jgi:hypothetical protein
MKSSIVNMMKIQTRLNEIYYDLQRLSGLSGWTDEELASRELGRDMDALRQHIDNASGRCSTVIQVLRRIG